MISQLRSKVNVKVSTLRKCDLQTCVDCSDPFCHDDLRARMAPEGMSFSGVFIKHVHGGKTQIKVLLSNHVPLVDFSQLRDGTEICPALLINDFLLRNVVFMVIFLMLVVKLLEQIRGILIKFDNHLTFSIILWQCSDADC